MSYYGSNFYAAKHYGSNYYGPVGAVVAAVTFFRKVFQNVLREITDEALDNDECC